MASYRFCRPDDMHLIIKAINTCVRVHTPELPPLGLDEYKDLVRKLNLWASSCMIALEKDKDDVVSIVVGCKREKETLVLMCGNRPDHMRRGHITHMLESLSQKLSILGPPRLLLEIPESHERMRELCEKLGFQKDFTFLDPYWNAALEKFEFGPKQKHLRYGKEL